MLGNDDGPLIITCRIFIMFVTMVNIILINTFIAFLNSRIYNTNKNIVKLFTTCLSDLFY